MGIAALSDSTIRAIGSSLVLNDATSVVKELLDNALDARASNIAIEISANTLDVIQLKDNGSGVGVEDRQRLCKRSCTSKIRTIEDLERLGGSSLGFRGEALASIVDLSADVTVTTRVGGEVVGTLIKYGPVGQILSSSSASHPVGTTVRVSNFLKTLPVRRQTTLKTTSKTLSNIKRLLQSYAFARPKTRFSLKVLRAKSDKSNWTYAANADSTLLQAAASIVGRDLASRCELKHISSGEACEQDQGDPSTHIDALLLSPEKEKVDAVGHYVAIDGRPVNTTRGTVQEVVKLYKAHFRSSYQTKHGSAASPNPFLCLHIRCPPRSYDVNIEPAKDEVLFFDSSNIIVLVEKLCVEYYGSTTETDGRTTDEAVTSRETTQQSSTGFNLLLARKPFSDRYQNDTSLPEAKVRPFISASPMNSSETTTSDVSVEEIPQRGSQHLNGAPAETPADTVPQRIHTMYSIAEQDLEYLSQPQSMQEGYTPEQEDAESIVKATNPWAIARMNAPIRIKTVDHGSIAEDDTIEPSTAQRPAPWGFSSPNALRDADQIPLLNGPALLPTPDISPRSPSPYQNPGPPLRPWRRRQDTSEDEIVMDEDPREGVQLQSTRLDTWVTPTALIRSSSPPESHQLFNKTYSTATPTGRAQKLPPGGLIATKSSPQSISAASNQMGRRAEPMRPFKSPLKAKVSDIMGLPPPMQSPQRSSALSSSPTLGSDPRTYSEDDGDLAEIMEWERRKKVLAKQHREHQSQLKIGNAFHDPGRLAKMQRESLQPQIESRLSNRDKTDRDETNRDETNHDVSQKAADLESRFGGAKISAGKASSSATQKNSPHRHRYLAAVRNLGREPQDQRPRAIGPSSDKIHGQASLTYSSNEDIAEILPQLPDSDPRGYLMRHQDDLKGDAGTGRNGLMLRRVRTMKLPLESIVKGSEVHNIVCHIPADESPTTPALNQAHTKLYKTDAYIKSGRNKFVLLSAFSKDIDTWQTRLRSLVQNLYRAKLGENDLVPPKLEIALARAIRSHMEYYEESRYGDAEK